MKKIFLLSYKTPAFFTLVEWVDYELTIETVWFWGLFKNQKVITYRIYDYQDTKTFFAWWNHLIANKLPLKQLKK